MQLDATDAGLLKTWIVNKLEDISDADSDVLAEYVLALVKGDEDTAVLRSNCISNLSDFLQESTESFVDSVITALQTKSYDPNRNAPTTASRPSATHAPNGPRKRTFDERDDSNAQHGRYDRQRDRPIKQARRGRGGRQDQQQGWRAPPFQADAISNMNPQDVMNAFLAFQQAMGVSVFPQPSQRTNESRRPRGRCRDFDSQGFCTRGMTCPYMHAQEPGDAGHDFYQHPSLPQPSRSGTFDMMSGQGRDMAKAQGSQNKTSSRSALSLAGPNHDRSLTSLVIEQIPEEKLDEQVVHDFFTQYGQITNVQLQAQKRLAVVTFVDWETANAAYKSPKVIFDNRFVKVYWLRTDDHKANGHSTMGQDPDMQVDEPALDHDAIAKRQEEAQRKHEEASRQREIARQQKIDIDNKLRAMAEERDALAQRLNKKNVSTSDEQESEQTKGLRAQLAKLEAEAESLGIDPNSAQTWQSNSRGRGMHRGRGRFSTRAMYRGAYNDAARGGAVKRLDNRPRTVSVAFSDGTYEQHEEALKQYMLFSNNLENATLSEHPDRRDAAVLAFTERYRAEIFMAATKTPIGIPNIGPVEVSWVSNSVQPNTTVAMDGVSTSANDASMASDVPQPANGNSNYDTMEDDRWA